MKSYLDCELLHRMLSGAARARGLSMREIATIAGVSASTITRLKAGNEPSSSGLLSLCLFLGVDATCFVRIK